MDHVFTLTFKHTAPFSCMLLYIYTQTQCLVLLELISIQYGSMHQIFILQLAGLEP